MVSAADDPASFVDRLPPPFQQSYRGGWADKYATLNVWG
jgi:hypothetical protein